MLVILLLSERGRRSGLNERVVSRVGLGACQSTSDNLLGEGGNQGRINPWLLTLRLLRYFGPPLKLFRSNTLPAHKLSHN